MNRVSAVLTPNVTSTSEALSPKGSSCGAVAEAVFPGLFVHFLWLWSFKA